MNTREGFFTLYGVFLCLFHISLFLESGALETLEVDKLCRESNPVILENYISASLRATENKLLDCTIILKAHPFSSVFISFSLYIIGENDSLVFSDKEGNQLSLASDRDHHDKKGSFLFKGPVTMHYVTYDEVTHFNVNFSVFEVYCFPGTFRCSNDLCIKNYFVCDGLNNCGDWSDEGNCREECNPNEFHCSNNKCIPRYKICDYKDDCGDGSDEADCLRLCKSNEFKCLNGKCLPQNKVCDDQNDCGDGSDETNCYQKCDFRCSNNKCISRYQVCDLKDDCGDMSDEKICSSRRKMTEDQFDRRVGLSIVSPAILSVLAIVLAVIFSIVFGVCFCVLMKKKADHQPTNNAISESHQPAPSSILGRLRQSFRSHGQPTAPQLEMVPSTEGAPPGWQQTPSVIGRIRRSLRSNRQPAVHPQNTNTTPDLSAQNSAIYPRLAPAEDLSGADNPEFKIEE